MLSKAATVRSACRAANIAPCVCGCVRCRHLRDLLSREWLYPDPHLQTLRRRSVRCALHVCTLLLGQCSHQRMSKLERGGEGGGGAPHAHIHRVQCVMLKAVTVGALCMRRLCECWRVKGQQRRAGERTRRRPVSTMPRPGPLADSARSVYVCTGSRE
jgi:hypothetical protein